jgi:hypothetical protein
LIEGCPVIGAIRGVLATLAKGSSPASEIHAGNREEPLRSVTFQDCHANVLCSDALFEATNQYFCFGGGHWAPGSDAILSQSCFRFVSSFKQEKQDRIAFLINCSVNWLDFSVFMDKHTVSWDDNCVLSISLHWQGIDATLTDTENRGLLCDWQSRSHIVSPTIT